MRSILLLAILSVVSAMAPFQFPSANFTSICADCEGVNETSYQQPDFIDLDSMMAPYTFPSANFTSICEDCEDADAVVNVTSYLRGGVKQNYTVFINWDTEDGV